MSKLYVDAITNREGVNAVNFPDGITGTAATFTGNVTIGGTLTYEDVTNIDSVGLITARNGLEITSGGINVNSGGANITGVLTATSFSGDGSNLQNISLPADANINITGTITAASFTGDGSGLVFAPKVIAFNPAALGTGVAVDTNITITFDQNIQFAGTGTVELRYSTYVAPNSEWSSNTGTLIESFAITNGSAASGLNISGTQLIITPTSDLPNTSTIYIVLPSQGIQGTSGSLYYAGSNNYSFRTVTTSFSAQGGDHVYTLVDGSSPTGYYKYHVFTSTTNAGFVTFTAATSEATDFKIMLLAGGGAGGGYGPPSFSRGAGGGGGAGGLLLHTGPTLNLPSGTYSVSVGAGGTGIPNPSPNPYPIALEAMNGRPSRLDGNGLSVIASGGGGGGQGSPVGGPPTTGFWGGQAGGSGGGGGGRWVNPPYDGWEIDYNDPGGGNVPGQGNAGGTGHNLTAAVHIGIPLASRQGSPAPPTRYPNGYDVGVSGGGGGAGGAGGQGSNIYIWNPSQQTPYRTAFIGGQGGNGIAVPEFGFVQLNGNVPTIPTTTLSSIGPTGLYGGGGGGAGHPGPGQGAGGINGTGGGGAGWPWGGTAPAYINAGYTNPGAPYHGNDFQGGGGGGSANNQGTNGGQGLVVLRYAVPGT